MTPKDGATQESKERTKKRMSPARRCKWDSPALDDARKVVVALMSEDRAWSHVTAANASKLLGDIREWSYRLELQRSLKEIAARCQIQSIDGVLRGHVLGLSSRL